LILILSAIAAIASVVGAIFATWRWDYARKAFDLQKKQIYLQVLMLAESREYWRTPKMQYVDKKMKYKATLGEEIKYVLKELERIFKR